jgi:hypothetical protein
MKKIYISLFLFITVSTTAIGQQSQEQFVRDNIPFFEHMFAVMTMTSNPIQQQSYFGHLKLSELEGQIVLKIVAEFEATQRILREQAYLSLSEKRPDMGSTLSQIRSQRSQLLLGSAMALMERIGPDGAKRIRDYVKRVTENIPKQIGK